MRERSEKQFRIGIGINTGDATIGNFGPPVLLSYTPSVYSINFGSRLERETRNYGVGIIIGESTYLNAKESIIARKLDAFERDRVNCRERPIPPRERVISKPSTQAAAPTYLHPSICSDAPNMREHTRIDRIPHFLRPCAAP